MNILSFIQSDNLGSINRNSLESITCDQKLSKKMNSKLTFITFDKEIIKELEKYDSTQIIHIEIEKNRFHEPIYSFKKPLSPHLASSYEKISINMKFLVHN